MPRISNLNSYGEETFVYLISKLINNFCLNDLELDYKFYKLRTENNINLLFNKFVLIFATIDF